VHETDWFQTTKFGNRANVAGCVMINRAGFEPGTLTVWHSHPFGTTRLGRFLP